MCRLGQSTHPGYKKREPPLKLGYFDQKSQFFAQNLFDTFIFWPETDKLPKNLAETSDNFFFELDIFPWFPPPGILGFQTPHQIFFFFQKKG